MAIMRWRPWGDLVNIQDEVNRLFDDSFGRIPARWIESGARWSPAVDISENKDKIYVDVEIPGMKKEDIKVSLENSVLSLKGEKKQEREIKEEKEQVARAIEYAEQSKGARLPRANSPRCQDCGSAICGFPVSGKPWVRR